MSLLKARKRNSLRRVLLVGLLSVLVIGGSRIAIPVYQNRESLRTDPAALDKRARPSDRVLQLLRREDAAAPKFDGQFPCVFATFTDTAVRPLVGKCGLPAERSEPVDRFEADLRYGALILRQSD